MIRVHLGVAVLIAMTTHPLAGNGVRAPLLFPKRRSAPAVQGLATRQKPIQDARPTGETAPAPQANTGAESDIKALQGNWQVIKWEDETGEQVPPEELKQFTFHFEGDHLTMHKFKDDAGTKCQFRLDATKEPRWIDLGMPALEPGATVLEGIYSLKGEVLNLCIISGQRNGVAPPRPSEFKTGPGEKYAVLALKRIP